MHDEDIVSAASSALCAALGSEDALPLTPHSPYMLLSVGSQQELMPEFQLHAAGSPEPRMTSDTPIDLEAHLSHPNADPLMQFQLLVAACTGETQVDVSDRLQCLHAELMRGAASAGTLENLEWLLTLSTKGRSKSNVAS